MSDWDETGGSEFNAKGGVPNPVECRPRRGGRRRALHDHPQRQQRQVRPARRHVPRQAGRELRIRPPGAGPRGYFGHDRDAFLLDGKVPPGINQGVPGTSAGKLLLPVGPLRPAPARFNDETMTLQNWPAKDKHIVIGEFHF